MTKDVWLSIQGTQFQNGEEMETDIQTMVSGTYYEKGGRHYVVYEESIEGVQKPVMSRLKFGEHFLELSRNGSLCMRMVFEENKKHMTDYHTPYGDILLGIDTKKINMINTDDEITIQADYLLEQNNEYLAKRRILITIRSSI
ncbi:MAG: DUF1934 domain-containing protein [Bacillus sp. (in: Bacteria)]|nr:DUF1934 domain-containing protein [Bacillus sp. (in: firmicutes)]MCM1426198.1 DUF1934 domain-containing protein [Eubacterium sp.]